MKKICLLICLFSLLLCSCVKKEKLGTIKEIKAFNVLQKLDQNESMILIIGTSTCETCIDFHKKVENYILNNKVMLYQLLIDNEPLILDENCEETRKDFIELEKRLIKIESTPTIIWIKNGKIKYIFRGNMNIDNFDRYNKKYNFTK